MPMVPGWAGPRSERGYGDNGHGPPPTGCGSNRRIAATFLGGSNREESAQPRGRNDEAKPRALVSLRAGAGQLH